MLRDELGLSSVKDGCSPQGQCGCCTVLVDGRPRVACVTPVRRVAGREVTTVDGLDPVRRAGLVDAFVAHGASQCGFCTPGILCRLAVLDAGADAAEVEEALLAHLCRCTGWRTIVNAAVDALAATGATAVPADTTGPAATAGTAGPGTTPPAGRPAGAGGGPAERRAALEGGVAQRSGAGVVLGEGGFSADTVPADALVAVPDGSGGWAVAATRREARAGVTPVQGRRSGREVTPPLAVPAGDWVLTLATSWVEPAYLEPDAAWCAPGGEPSSPLANGGAFGAKATSPVTGAARALADRHGRTVLAVATREDVVRWGVKRPPVAAGIRSDGTGVLRVVRTPGVAAAVASVAPGLVVEEVDVAGPPTSAAVRGAGWVEAAVLLAALRSGPGASDDRLPPAVVPGVGTGEVTAPSGGRARARVTVDAEGRPTDVEVVVAAGEVLDAVVLRSYVVGAAHMALGWVTTEGIAVGSDGVPADLTIRSFGILRARDTPPVRVEVEETDTARGPAPAVAVGDAAFAAVAAAVWGALGLPPSWPARRGGVPPR